MTDSKRQTECHICHRPTDAPGEVWCSYPHPLAAESSRHSIREALLLGARIAPHPTDNSFADALAVLDDLVEQLGAMREALWRYREEIGHIQRGGIAGPEACIRGCPGCMADAIFRAESSPACEHVWRDIAGSGLASCDKCGVSSPASEPRPEEGV